MCKTRRSAKNGTCMTTCGAGSQQKSRTCNNPAPKAKGSECVGGPTDQKPCDPPNAACPSNHYIFEYINRIC